MMAASSEQQGFTLSAGFSEDRVSLGIGRAVRTMASSVRSKLAQLRSVFPITLLTFTAGMSIGWASPALYKLAGDKNADPFPASPEEVSWIASFMDVGLLVGTIVGGVVFSRFGRRTTMLIPPVAQVVWALLIYFATSAVYLYVARAAAGVGIAIVLMFGAIYVGEVSSPDTRGPLTLLGVASLLVGTLYEYAMGPNVTFKTQAALGIPPPVVALFLTIFCMDESPYYLAMVHRYKDMIKVLVKLRGAASESEVMEEAADIQAAVEKQMASSATLRETFAEPGTRRAALIVLALRGSTALFGNVTIMTYAQIIFKETGSPLEDDVSVMVLFGAQLVGFLLSFKLVNSSGRRPLQIITLSVCGISLGGVAVIQFLKEAVQVDIPSSMSWIPLTFFLVYRLSSGLGAYSLADVLAGELLDQRSKTIVAPMAALLVAVTAFISNKMFVVIQESVGMYLPFALFAVWNLLGAGFCAIMVPETRGKTLAEVQDIVRGWNGRKYSESQPKK